MGVLSSVAISSTLIHFHLEEVGKRLIPGKEGSGSKQNLQGTSGEVVSSYKPLLGPKLGLYKVGSSSHI